MRRPRQRSGLRRRHKCARQQDALRMRGSEPRMNTAILFVEHVDDFPAQGQESFHPSSGAWLDPPSNGFTFYHRGGSAAAINASQTYLKFPDQTAWVSLSVG